MTKEKIKEYQKLIIISILIGFLCALLGDSLKKITEQYEDIFFKIITRYKFSIFLFPLLGLSIIHLLRKYLFNNKENKGIKEIYATLYSRHNELPAYKIPSHYINGFLTVIFGGSTGIEVPTVVASAAIGVLAQKKGNIHVAFRKQLISAGVAAGVAVIFNSPIAGIIFALEVISKKITTLGVISILVAVLTASGFNYILQAEPFLKISITTWHYHAIPYFIVLGFFAGLNGAYLTKCVLFFKLKFATLKQYSTKIIISSTILSTAILFFPQLYGDGYQAMHHIFAQPTQQLHCDYTLLLVAGSLLLLKPLVSAATLAAGGDGGVFAPSLFIGAFLGLFVSLILNKYFDANVIPLNFMVIGMAAVLSASLHAPFTAIFLICGLVNNYVLIIPICIACMVAKMTAKILLPYTVYSYAVTT